METRNDKLCDMLDGLGLDIDFGHMDLDNATDYSTLYDEVQESGQFDKEVIYYAHAMELLTEHDTSLSESLSLASDMGYDPKDLNSEILASLLMSQMIREEFAEAEGQIDDIFEELEEWEAEQTEDDDE